MPKRTNDFQHLVALIQRSLSPRGAVVTESAIVESNGVAREVDVLINSAIGIYRMKIAVEAKDHRRPLDITAIETIIGKYRSPDGIPVNQVVLVTRRGLTRTALERAKSSNIRTITLNEAKVTDWTNLVPIDRPHGMVLAIAPQLAYVEILPKIENAASPLLSVESVIKCKTCGRPNGSPSKVGGQILQQRLPLDQRAKIKQIIDHWKASRKDGKFCVRVNWRPMNKILIWKNAEYPVEEMILHLHGQQHKGDLDFQCYEMTTDTGERYIVQRGSGRIGSKRVELILPQGLKSPQITLDIKDICEGE